MLEIFQYSFMIRALIAGVAAALVLPVLGSFLVARRYAMIADSLAHVSLAGIGAGLLFEVSPVYMALPVAVSGALLLEYLRQNKLLNGDTGLALLMSGGLAIAVVLAGLSGGKSDFNTYLFGSITATSLQDLWLLIPVACLIALYLWLSFTTLLHITFDEDSARIAGYKVTLHNYVLTAITAVLVVLCLRIIGGLLIGALLVIPVLAASRLAKSFVHTVLFAVAIACASVVIGLLIAFYAGIAAGGAIVLVTLAIFITTLLLPRS